MKKISLFIVLGIFILNFSVSGAKYDDAVPIIKKMIASLEAFISNMEKGKDAKAIATALDNYSKAVQEFAPDVRKMMKDYPELKDEKNHPEELRPYTKKFEDLTKKMMGLFVKVRKYINDPIVKEANKNFMKAMSTLEDKQEEEEDIKK